MSSNGTGGRRNLIFGARAVQPKETGARGTSLQVASGKKAAGTETGASLFESASHECWETVFADPSVAMSLRMSVGRSEVGRSSFFGPGLADEAAARPAIQEELVVCNLNTGAVRVVGEQPLDAAFLGSIASAPELLDHGIEQLGQWTCWWRERQSRQKTIWSAAASGNVSDLAAALKGPQDGFFPLQAAERDDEGRTPLHAASRSGSIECVERLLAARADIHATTFDESLTPLHVACQHGHSEVAGLLLNEGADAMASLEDSSLAIHLAAAAGHPHVVAALLRHPSARSQLSARTDAGQLPSEVAADADTVAAFRRAGGDDYAHRTPLGRDQLVLRNARADAVQRLLAPVAKLRAEERAQQGSGLAEIQLKEGSATVASRKPKSRVRQAFATVIAENEEKRAKRRAEEEALAAEEEVVGPDSFELVKLLGKGSFGEVFEVTHKGTGEGYAMKILKKNKVCKANVLRYTITERNVLSYIRHPYIVSLNFAFQTPSYLVLVLQLCTRGNLQHLLTKHKRLKEPVTRLYAAQVLLALCHLHENQIIYRDLKPENVVLDGEANALLTDFGLSKEGVEGLQGTRSFCGSVAFLAPEIIMRQGHGHTVDVYGLGVLVYDMLTGLPPFYHKNRETLFTNIKQGALKMPSYVQPEARSLILHTLVRNPRERLGAANTSDVQSHPFFAAIDWEALMRRDVCADDLLPTSDATAARPAASVGNVTAAAATPKEPAAPADPFTTASAVDEAADHPNVKDWDFRMPAS